jgi:glycine C-acetyltransferase
MDGDIAKLKEICDLAEKYDALVMVDDSHATGYIGPTGRGTAEYCGVMGRVDIITTPKKVIKNADYFREKMVAAGFDIVPGKTAIVPVMIYDEPLAVKMAEKMLEEGIYVIVFTYPVVPKGKARIRVQLSAAHSKWQLDKAITVFIKVGKELEII